MSERKVLQKYYPPDFDYREIGRRKGPKQTGPKVQTVRLMAPFSMRCTSCGEFIYKGRKFNSRKEIPQDEKYLNIQIFFFHIKCTRCSGEITFRTDPKNNDYAMVRGAVRNMEPWRNRGAEEESINDRLDRIEREEAEAPAEEERNAMAELEAKNDETRREMAAADALDEIRKRNARINRSEKEDIDFADTVVRSEDEERQRQDEEDEAAARRAFAAARARTDVADATSSGGRVVVSPVAAAVPSELDSMLDADEALMPPPPVPAPVTKAADPLNLPGASAPSFKRVVKKKKDRSALLGIKKASSLV
ncbi:protein of unknown function DUF572 [Geosmithia morbida]|uniref:Splicing factor YJU2 n=1 Tax=Geosmithia morbida TaxID=1094350 RepID=A0A9P5CZ88_9HYPO|nr:protein of unknown function DUF572 [Geosmithia morbida]KAF4120197.1 protein of unknown function DUF572 [Geosmithia morbida]